MLFTPSVANRKQKRRSSEVHRLVAHVDDGRRPALLTRGRRRRDRRAHHELPVGGAAADGAGVTVLPPRPGRRPVARDAELTHRAASVRHDNGGPTGRDVLTTSGRVLAGVRVVADDVRTRVADAVAIVDVSIHHDHFRCRRCLGGGVVGWRRRGRLIPGVVV